MKQNQSLRLDDSGLFSMNQVIHKLLDAWRIIRYRKHILIASVLIFGVLGALYYKTSDRLYEGKATLMIIQKAPNATTATSSYNNPQTYMTTYQDLVTQEVILQDAINRISKLSPEAKIDLADHDREKWIGILRKNLTAKAKANTNFVNLTYTSHSSEAAGAVINAIVTSYTEFIKKHHRNASDELTKLLEKNLTDIEQRLTAKEKERSTLMSSYGDYTMKANSTVEHPRIDTLVQLNRALTEIQKRRLELDAVSTSIRSGIHGGGDLRHHLLAVEPTVGREFIMNALGFNEQEAAVIGQVEQEMLQKQSELEALRKHYGPAHPEVQDKLFTIRNQQEYIAKHQIRIQQKLASIQSEKLGKMLVGLIDEELLTVRQHETRLEAECKRAEEEVVALHGRQYQIACIERECARLQTLNEVIVNQIDDVKISQDRADISTAIVTSPEGGKNPVWPNLPLVGIITLGLGLGVGYLVAWVCDILDDRFRTPEEMQDQIGAPILSLIPALPESDFSDHPDVLDIVFAPDSNQGESFRTLRTALSLSADVDSSRFVITSTNPGEGKTFVAANLAATFALAGKKTLIIDGDLRRPGLSTRLDLRNIEGLGDILRSSEDVGQLASGMIQQSTTENLAVLPVGRRVVDPAELLISPRFADLLLWAESEYDVILIDSPPVMATSDSAIMGRLVEGVVFVVDPSKTQRRRIVHAATQLQNLGVRVMGMVPNRIGAEGGQYYSEYTSDYSYGYSEKDRDNHVHQHESTEQDGQQDDDTIRPRHAA